MVSNLFHKLGISFITLAFIYILIISVINKKPLLPFWFYLLYGIGGMFIFITMLKKHKPFIYYNELIGVLITFILSIHSFIYYKI